MPKTQELNLKNIPCPINFVRTKIKLDEMQPGEILAVLLDDGEPIESVTKSVQEEGHKVLSSESIENHWCLTIEKIQN